MKGIMKLLALFIASGLCSPALAEEGWSFDTITVWGKSFDTKPEPMHPETDGVTRPVTFYCCDKMGKVTCTVNAPGPVGEPCFCPGVVPAGTLCMPR